MEIGTTTRIKRFVNGTWNFCSFALWWKSNDSSSLRKMKHLRFVVKKRGQGNECLKGVNWIHKSALLIYPSPGASILKQGANTWEARRRSHNFAGIVENYKERSSSPRWNCRRRKFLNTFFFRRHPWFQKSTTNASPLAPRTTNFLLENESP